MDDRGRLSSNECRKICWINSTGNRSSAETTLGALVFFMTSLCCLVVLKASIRALFFVVANSEACFMGRPLVGTPLLALVIFLTFADRLPRTLSSTNWGFLPLLSISVLVVSNSIRDVLGKVFD